MMPLSQRLRRRPAVDPPRLNLTAMVDVFVVLLIFLLKSYSAEGNIITNNQNLELPVSTSTLEPQVTLVLTLTKDAIYVDDKKVEEIASAKEGEELLLPALAQELEYQAERARFMAGLSPSGKFEGKITILGDRELPFVVLEKVMFTASAKEYNEISLAVFQK